MTARLAIQPKLQSAIPVRWEIAPDPVPYDVAVARMEHEVEAIAKGDAADCERKAVVAGSVSAGGGRSETNRSASSQSVNSVQDIRTPKVLSARQGGGTGKVPGQGSRCLSKGSDLFANGENDNA